jgi:high frequency lysogenization protein
MNFNQKTYNSTLALAGILQSAAIVHDFAKVGFADSTAFETSIHSIFKIDAESVIDVFGSEKGLRLGLQQVIRLLGNEKPGHDRNVGRYVVGIFILAKKLSKNPEMIKNLRRRIAYASSQSQYFSETHTTVLNSLADIYLNTIGRLPYRLKVLGQAKYLHQNDIVYKIRAVLLAGIRAAVLWQQVGGIRWQLFFSRKKFVDMAKKILEKT